MSATRNGGGGRRGPTKETQELVAQRRAELTADKRQEEKKFVQGRWVTDTGALKNIEARRKEMHNRRAPKQLAKLSLLTQSEDTNTGIETEEHEVADRVTQQDILDGVDLQTQQKKFSLTLDKLGPYKVDFTINGTHLLLAGLRGHMANLRWKSFALEGEAQLKDKINDACFLVDHTMTAVAQKRYVYMYTKEGTEMHILSKFMNMDRLAYLPKHMLLAAASSQYSVMQYLDVSTGQELGAKVPAVMRDPTSCLAVNPANAIVASCDLRGVVKFWSPSVVDPLVQLKGHQGVVEDIRFHPNGRFFVTLGGDHKLKVWDCRTLRTLEEYAVTYDFHTLDISSSGLVALGGGTNVQIWRDMFSTSKPNAPYMKFGLGYGNIAERVRFCPFEDVLGIGHSKGFTSMLIPGAGEANPDFYYANPHETDRHRKERVVTNLLDKLPPDTISMDIQVAGVNEARLAAYTENIQRNRKVKLVREKKQRRADRAAKQAGGAGAAPSGVSGAHEDDELDEDIGFKEAPKTRDLKSKLEVNREKKMAKWDKKDSADKVRSKQTMRQSRMVQKRRAYAARDDRIGAYNKDDLDSEEEALVAGEAARKKTEQRRKRAAAAEAGDDVRTLLSASFGGDDLIPRRRQQQQQRTESSSGRGGGGYDDDGGGVGDDSMAAEANAAFRRFLR